MGDTFSIDFREIRPYDGDRRKGFEELLCQLARRESTHEKGEFRRVEGAGGDGGVEAYWLYKDDTEHGYQAKYFLATKDIDWSQIDKSVKAALRQHSKLTQYTIAIACDLTDRSGKLGKGKTGWQHWKAHKSKWEQWASAKGMTVEFFPWTKSELTDRLVASTAHRGLVLWWFNVCLFDEEWFQHLFERARADLDERFQPEDHVEVVLASAFDGLSRSPAYRNFLSKWFCELPGLENLASDLRKLNFPLEEKFVQLENQCAAFRKIGESIHTYEAQPFPIADWQHEIRSASNATLAIREWLHSQNTDGNDTASSAKQNALQCLGKIGTHLDRTPIHLGANNSHEIRIESDSRRVLIVVGEAGSGKSHLFAGTVATSLTHGIPAILLLGQNFAGHEIRSEFLHYLDLANYDFDTVLQALNAAGEAAKSRLIILIDALNETDTLRMWNDQLAGFVSDILQYEWLAVGVSLRPEYEPRLLPELVRNKAVRAICQGIQSPD